MMSELYEVVVAFDRGTSAYFEMTYEDLVNFLNDIDNEVNSEYVGIEDRGDGTTVNINTTRILFVYHKLKEAE